MGDKLTIKQRIGGMRTALTTLAESREADLRVAMPGIITYFDSVEQVVNVQPAIAENVVQSNGTVVSTQLPELLDVPIVIPQCAGYALTMPIAVGDECLVIFGDMCIDAWWQSGGVQGQVERRRHDLSDAFAIVGIASQPNVLPNYNTEAMELRTHDGNTKIKIASGRIDLNAAKVYYNGSEVKTV